MYWESLDWRICPVLVVGSDVEQAVGDCQCWGSNQRTGKVNGKVKLATRVKSDFKCRWHVSWKLE